MKNANLASKGTSLKGVRLNKFISYSGLCSRREADQFIRNKKVIVNNVIIRDLGCYVYPHKDQVKVSGKIVQIPTHKIYIAFNKPKKVLSTTKDSKGRVCVSDFFKERKNFRVFPVGRLDWSSEGLILLTNDGDFSEKILRPKNKIAKTYLVKLDNEVNYKHLDRLVRGVSTEKGRLNALYAQDMKVARRRSKKMGASTWVKVIIDEGKNRQLHRMFQSIGFSIKVLRRVAIGRLKLKSLKPGESFLLKPSDIKKIFLLPSELRKQKY